MNTRKQTTVLKEVYKGLLKLTEVVALPELSEKDLAFGFVPNFDGHTNFMIYTSPAAAGKPITCTAKFGLESSSYEVVCDMLKKNFSYHGWRKNLTEYFEVEFFAHLWRVWKCGPYYICENAPGGFWGEFCITKSKKFADFWIQKKRRGYDSYLEKYWNETISAQFEIKDIEQTQIPKFDEAVVKFKKEKLFVKNDGNYQQLLDELLFLGKRHTVLIIPANEIVARMLEITKKILKVKFEETYLTHEDVLADLSKPYEERRVHL